MSSEQAGRPPALKASVIVRAKDKEATIERTLKSVRSQTVEAELIVVDSGSTDRTLDIAKAYDAEIVEIAPSDFTYGRALNIGAAHATGDIMFALSAHSAPSTDRWIEYSLEAYRDPLSAATFGHAADPKRVLLAEPRQIFGGDLDLKNNFGWGMSNHASSWRKSVWEKFPFNEQLAANEDKEWMWRVLSDGYAIVVDPRLVVDVEHRWAEGVRALYKRTYREHAAATELVAVEGFTVRDTVRKWWVNVHEGSRPAWQRRLSPKRNTTLVAGYFGVRAGRSQQGPHTMMPSSVGRTRSSDEHVIELTNVRTSAGATDDRGGKQ